MKKYLLQLLLCLPALGAGINNPVFPPATLNDLARGTNKYVFVSPYTLRQYIPGTNQTTVTNWILITNYTTITNLTLTTNVYNTTNIYNTTNFASITNYIFYTNGVVLNFQGSNGITVSTITNSSTDYTILVVGENTNACTAPTISSQPSSISGSTNTSLTVSVTAGGTSPLYQWHLGQSATNLIAGATASSYSTNSVTATTNYYCVTVSNSCGVVTSSVATVSWTNGVGGGGGNGLLSGLMAYWKMEDADGANRADAVASYTLTQHGTVFKTVATAKHLYGANTGSSRYLDSSDAAFRRTTSWTVAGWFSSVGGCDGNAFVSEWGSGHNWAVEGIGSTPAFFMRNNSDSSNITAPSTVTWISQAWHLVAFGYDASAQKIWIQVDNETRQEASYTDTPRTDSDSFTVCDFSGGSGSALGGGTDWGVDELGYWTRSLSTSDISALWNSGTGLFYDSFTN